MADDEKRIVSKACSVLSGLLPTAVRKGKKHEAIVSSKQLGKILRIRNVALTVRTVQFAGLCLRNPGRRVAPIGKTEVIVQTSPSLPRIRLEGLDSGRRIVAARAGRVTAAKP